MSIQTKLYIDDKVYNVKEFSHRLTRGNNPSGMGNNKIRHWGLNIVIEATADNDIYEWSIEDNFTKNIEIRLTPNHIGSGKTRVINAYDCHCLEYDVHFNSRDNQPMTETMHLSVGGFKDTNSSAEYSELWRKTFDDDTPLTVVDEEEEPEIISCQYTDMDGNPIDELYEDKLILEVKTKNCIGKIVDIDLSDDEYDFSYKGKHLNKDILEDLKITADLQKVELEVYEEE